MTPSDPSRIWVVAKPTGRWTGVRSRLTAAGVPREQMLLTTPSETGAGLARHAVAAGARRIVVVGGDGTVRVVAGALAGSDVELGIVPTGTANLAARNLGLPRRGRAVDVAVGGRARRVDVGWAALEEAPTAPFLVVTGLGNDAQTLTRAGERAKRVLGWPVYVGAGIPLLGRDGPAVSIDGEQPEPAWSVLVANAGGLPMRTSFAPGARMDDGQLHLLRVRVNRPWDWAHVAWSGLRRRPGRDVVLQRRTGTSFVLTSDVSVPVQVDGDVLGEGHRLEVTIQPGALLVAR